MESVKPAPYHGAMLGGGRSFTLFRVRGVRISVDWSWFLVLFFVIFWMSRFYGDLMGESGSSTTPFLLAVLSPAGFFGSTALQALGHGTPAVRNGMNISGIHHWIF